MSRHHGALLLASVLLPWFQSGNLQTVPTVDLPLAPNDDLVSEILEQRPDIFPATSVEDSPPDSGGDSSNHGDGNSLGNSPIATVPSAPGGTGNGLSTPPTSGVKSCGGLVEVTQDSGSAIFSPGYPESYPPNVHCEWRIRAPPGKKVVGHFSEFDLTDSEGCGSDFVQISGVSAFERLRGRGEDVRRHCGKIAPGELEAAAGAEAELRLVFHSNQGDACKGFAFQYRLVKSHVTCGEVTSSSEFEFTNKEFPGPVANETQHCSLQVSHDCEKPICQLRLDLLDFELSPPTAGNCERDQFIVRANEPLPVLCGKNSGQHFYVDVRGRQTTDLNFMMDKLQSKPVGFFNPETNEKQVEWRPELDRPRNWNIRVTQIPCDCHEKESKEMILAPPGCLQYYQGLTGKIQSFNFDGAVRNYEPCFNGTEAECGQELFTGHLNNLEYTVCIKEAHGYCGIAYSALNLDDFQMSGILDYSTNPDLEGVPPLFGEASCYEDYIFISRGHHPEDLQVQYAAERYCGHRLGNRLAGPVVSNSRPFLMRVKTDSKEPFTGVAMSNRGFNLLYKQIPCTLSNADAVSFI